MMLLSNCNGKNKPTNANTAEKVTLAQLESALETGPLFIGENHLKPYARAAIIELINKKCVKQIFLELANVEDLDHKDDPKHNKLFNYLSSKSRAEDEDTEAELEGLLEYFRYREITGRRDQSSILIDDLIRLVLAQKDIAIYFHDVPSFSDPNKEILIHGKKYPTDFPTERSQLQARNIYASDFIKHNKLGAGTIILAGQFHLDERETGEGYTLQSLLDYGNDNTRVFNLSNEAIN
jgi:hypothetical protein